MPDLNPLLGSLFCGPADLLYGIAPARANVVSMKSRQIHFLQGENVGFRDVKNVYIVANACAISGRVIGSVDLKAFPPPRGSLQQQRNNVGLWLVPFAPTLLASASIEVAEGNHAPAIGKCIPFQDALQHQLALTVGIHRFLRMVFFDRDGFRQSIDSGRRGKNKFSNAMLPKRFQHRYAGSNVSVKESTGIDHRLCYQRLGCEVEDHVELFAGQQACQSVTVTEVKPVEPYTIRNSFGVSGGEVIQHLDRKAPVHQLSAASGAHVSGAARY